MGVMGGGRQDKSKGWALTCEVRESKEFMIPLPALCIQILGFILKTKGKKKKKEIKRTPESDVISHSVSNGGIGDQRLWIRAQDDRFSLKGQES